MFKIPECCVLVHLFGWASTITWTSVFISAPRSANTRLITFLLLGKVFTTAYDRRCRFCSTVLELLLKIVLVMISVALMKVFLANKRSINDGPPLLNPRQCVTATMSFTAETVTTQVVYWCLTCSGYVWTAEGLDLLTCVGWPLSVLDCIELLVMGSLG